MVKHFPDFEEAICKIFKGNIHVVHHLRLRKNMAKENMERIWKVLQCKKLTRSSQNVLST